MSKTPDLSPREVLESDFRIIDAHLLDVMRALFYGEQSKTEEGMKEGLAKAKAQLNKAMDRMKLVQKTVRTQQIN
jgi:hypothetical protein